MRPDGGSLEPAGRSTRLTSTNRPQRGREVSPGQVSVSLRLQVPSTATIEVIEEACVKASRKAARDAMSEPCRQMEHARARRSSKTRGRRPTILTRCGYLTITRGPSRSPDGSEYFPLDERLGPAPPHEGSPYVRRRGCELVACHPSREAARLLSGAG